jgi:hypothetical protein
MYSRLFAQSFGYWLDQASIDGYGREGNASTASVVSSK